jgi:membrane-bound lytic murein transglycosylase B
MIAELLDYDGSGKRNLTKWEIDFLESVADQMEQRGLTPKQAKVLDKLWTDIFG